MAQRKKVALPRSSGDSFWDVVDRMVAKSEREREQAKNTLKAMGWSLKPVSLGGVWRASRRSSKGVVRIYAASAAELIEECKANFVKPSKGEASGD